MNMLYQLDMSAVTEHSTQSHHWIKFPETEVLAKASGYMDQFAKEATETRHELNNTDMKVSKVLNPTTRSLRSSDTHPHVRYIHQ
jgi:hypothetical protein